MPLSKADKARAKRNAKRAVVKLRSSGALKKIGRENRAKSRGGASKEAGRAGGARKIRGGKVVREGGKVGASPRMLARFRKELNASAAREKRAAGNRGPARKGFGRRKVNVPAR